jgi:hypothetical protein
MRRLLPLLSALVLAGAPGAARGLAASGIRIVDPEGVRARFLVADGEALRVEVDGRSWELVTDPADSALSRLGDGTFHPMAPEEVRAALEALEPAPRGLEGLVLILPYPPRPMLRSSCTDRTILLAPGIREVAPAHVHATVAHEVGHLLQHARAPEGSAAWEDYLRLRGLDPARYHAGAAHRDRPREIFAEDFRVLFGGELATLSGTQENSDLPPPEEVPGLAQWFARLAAGRLPRSVPEPGARPRAFPNPFSARRDGELQVRFGRSGASPSRSYGAEVFDLAGRRIRRLSGARAEGSWLTFRWDGRDAHGRPVASGVYFVRLPGLPSAGVARVQILH